MSDARRVRLERELQRVLSELIARELKDPRVGNVTITAVTLAPDLATAKIFFVPFAGQHAPEEARRGLTHAGGFLRGEAGRRIGLRHAPRLEFEFDEQLERAQRLTDLIETAVKSDRANAPDAPDDTAR